MTAPPPQTPRLPAPAPPSSPPPVPTPSWHRVRLALELRPGPGAVGPLFALTLRSVLLGRRALFLLLFMLVPAYIGLIIHGSVGMDEYQENTYWGGAAPGASGGLLWFQDGAFGVLFPFLIPLVLAVYATSVVGEEVEAKTLPYLFTRPVYRNWILLAKAGAAYLGVYLLTCLSLTIFWFASVSLTENPFAQIGQLFGYFGVAALGILAAGGLFLVLGVLWRRAIVGIMFYLFVFEFALSHIPGLLFRRISLVNYQRPLLLELTGRTMTRDDIRVGFVDPMAATIILVVLGVLGLLGALVVVSTKDYNV